MQENEDGVLDLPDDDAASVETLLNYLYTRQYVLEVDRISTALAPPTPEDHIANLRAHFLVYKLSDKTGYLTLNCAAHERFKDGLCVPALITSPEFPKLMRQIYESTSATDDLRYQLTKHCVRLYETTSNTKAVCDVITEFEYMAWRVGHKIKDHDHDYIYELYLEQRALTKQNEEKVKALEARFGPLQ